MNDIDVSLRTDNSSYFTAQRVIEWSAHHNTHSSRPNIYDIIIKYCKFIICTTDMLLLDNVVTTQVVSSCDWLTSSCGAALIKKITTRGLTTLNLFLRSRTWNKIENILGRFLVCVDLLWLAGAEKTRKPIWSFGEWSSCTYEGRLWWHRIYS